MFLREFLDEWVDISLNEGVKIRYVREGNKIYKEMRDKKIQKKSRFVVKRTDKE